MSRNYKRRHTQTPHDIPTKANRVLNVILISMILILLRVWHLAIIQHDERLEESRRPQQRTVVESANRGTIRDRFNIPLAINKIQYNAAILYSQIKEVPAIVWEIKDGKKVKRYKRKEYINDFAKLLSHELNLDSDRLIDLIHSKASLYNSIPYTIKEDLTEVEYYRLKMLSKDWPGLHMQSVPKRYYPQGKVGGDIVGYMGAISLEEYESIIHKIKDIQTCLKDCESGLEPSFPKGIVSVDQAKERLNELIEHAYTINDYVGKAGVEGRFEENLRGYRGKRKFYTDAQGNFLYEMTTAKPSQPGQRILLTISAELQEYAEKLLIQNEQIRTPRVNLGDEDAKTKLAKKQPWIKGGAIVAMDPFTGDVLALASCPRFDPNDFIASGNQMVDREKKQNIRMWFETESFIGELWDQKRPLERDRFEVKEGEFVNEKLILTWDRYLDFILPEECCVKTALKAVKNVKNTVDFLQAFNELLAIAGQNAAYSVLNELYRTGDHKIYGKKLPAVQQEEIEERLAANVLEVKRLQRKLDPYFKLLPNNYDKVLFVDLCRLVVDPLLVSKELVDVIGQYTLSETRDAAAALVTIEETAKQMTRELFKEHHFKPWRDRYQKEFLKQKRIEEKIQGIKYPKPYLDILDRHELEMFEEFWGLHRWELIGVFLKGKEEGVTRVTSVASVEGVASIDSVARFTSVASVAEVVGGDGLDSGVASYRAHFKVWHKELLEGAHAELSWRSSYATLKNIIDKIPDKLVGEYFNSLRKYDDLTKPLYGRYRHLRVPRGQKVQLQKYLAGAFYPAHGFGFARSHAYRQASTQGSIFKLVTAYEALIQRYQKLGNKPCSEEVLNPLIINDDSHKRGRFSYVGYDVSGKPIPQLYKGGRIPRSHRAGMGKMDLLRALEMSSNPYFSLLSIDHMNDPNDLIRATNDFSLGCRTGIDLPAETAGRTPNDIDINRNGLYAMAIGQHSLVVTPLQTAVMLSSIANGGDILKPRIVNIIAGRGIEGDKETENFVFVPPTEIKRTLEMPSSVRKMLIEGMARVVHRTQFLSIGSLSQMYQNYPEAISDLVDLKGQLVGKSSTAESMEHIDLDLNLGTNMYNHICFGGIVYDKNGDKDKINGGRDKIKGKDEEGRAYRFTFKDSQGVPEIVVVVYLRYGAWGKDATPLAAQIAEKWREIKRKYESGSEKRL